MLAVDLPPPPKGYVPLRDTGRATWSKLHHYGASVAIYWPDEMMSALQVRFAGTIAYPLAEAKATPKGSYRFGIVHEVLTGTRALVELPTGQIVECNPEAVVIDPETGSRHPAAEDHAQLLPGLEAWAGKKTRRKSAKDKAGEAGGGRR